MPHRERLVGEPVRVRQQQGNAGQHRKQDERQLGERDRKRRVLHGQCPPVAMDNAESVVVEESETSYKLVFMAADVIFHPTSLANETRFGWVFYGARHLVSVAQFQSLQKAGLGNSNQFCFTARYVYSLRHLRYINNKEIASRTVWFPGMCHMFFCCDDPAYRYVLAGFISQGVLIAAVNSGYHYSKLLASAPALVDGTVSGHGNTGSA